MSNIEKLAADWIEAKKAETLAKTQRTAIEDQLTEALDVKIEGATTYQVGPYKVTLTGKQTRSMDAEVWNQVKDRIPENMWPVKVSTTVDATGCKYLADIAPDIWAKISEAFTTKPAKPAVAVKEY